MVDQESAACTPLPLDPGGFNPRCVLPYGLTTAAVQESMQSFLDFMGFINNQLRTKELPRLESMLMAANFSSMVGEFLGANIPKHCTRLTRNRHHNGHPDLIPTGQFPGEAVQYAHDGIEIKASRYDKAWQGHNAEAVFLVVFVFGSNGPRDEHLSVAPSPFRFKMAVGALLTLDDWKFSGRSETSRRTITASVTSSGYQKMVDNWIYLAPEMRDKLGR